jgi:hypothetical protein
MTAVSHIPSPRYLDLGLILPSCTTLKALQQVIYSLDLRSAMSLLLVAFTQKSKVRCSNFSFVLVLSNPFAYRQIFPDRPYGHHSSQREARRYRRDCMRSRRSRGRGTCSQMCMSTSFFGMNRYGECRTRTLVLAQGCVYRWVTLRRLILHVSDCTYTLSLASVLLLVEITDLYLIDFQVSTAKVV